MRNSCNSVGRMPRPDGSFVRAAGPTTADAREEHLRARCELARRPEGDRLPELGARLVPLAGPGEQEPEVEAHHLALREALRQRAEPRERRGEVVFVEAADRGGDLRLVVVRGEARRTQVEPLRRVLLA